MSSKLVLGSSSPVETSRVVCFSENESATVVVEGNYALVSAARPETFVPSGYVYSSHAVSSNGDGSGKLTVKCVRYEMAGSFGAERTTFSVDMVEESYDLQNHPTLASVRNTCVKWIADGCIAHDDNFYTLDEYEQEVKITDASAIKFCEAYMAGIKTFIRYFPVINRISTYKNPPGLSISGKGFSGGSPQFSSNVGKFDTPPITLNGFAATNFFKSKDSWEELTNRSWRRTEQWTYTTEGSTSSHAWIYQ